MEFNNKTGKPSVDKPWLKYYSDEARRLGVPTYTLYESLINNNRDYPDETAILYQNISISYRELFQRIEDCARALSAMGVKKDEIVTLGLASIPEAVVLFFAINKIGAIADFVHPLDSADNLCKHLASVNSKLSFMLPETYKLIHHNISSSTVEKAIVVSPSQSLSFFYRLLYRFKRNALMPLGKNRVITWKQFMRKGIGNAISYTSRANNDYALITQTGGTTGASKGVICTNRNILAAILQSVIDRPHKRQECMISVLPPFINYSLINTILEPLCCGLKTVLIPNYNPTKIAEYIKKYHVNHIISIPAYWAALLEVPHIERYDFSELGFICSGGERLEESIEEKVNSTLKKCGAKVELMKGSGMTEATSVVASTYPWCNPKNSVGIPCVMNNCKIVDVDTNQELGYGEIGEICISSPTLMAGYFNQPLLTEKRINVDDDGIRWLHTGDLGYISEDGVIYIKGRLKRLIMQKDDNGIVSKINPEIIEDAIMQYNNTECCCVLGIPSAEHINEIKAFIELKTNTTNVSIHKEKITSLCKEKLPSHMVPHDIVFIDKMPRTERGKIDYRTLGFTDTMNQTSIIY